MTDPKAAYRAARDAWTNGDTDRARSLYEDAIAADPTFPLSHFDFAALVERDDPALARWHYRRFVELAEGDARLADMVAKARHAMSTPKVQPPPPKPRPAPTASSGGGTSLQPGSKAATVLGWIVLILLGGVVILVLELIDTVF